MFHDRTLAARVVVDARPASAVSGATGVVGLAGLAIWIVVARHFSMDGPYAAVADVFACALPMVLWALLVDKVHRRRSTGLDWTLRRPWRETIGVSATKVVGLWLTWGLIATVYATERFYWDWSEGGFPFAMRCLAAAAPLLAVASIPYIIWLDRHAVEPRDGCWALGRWALSLGGRADGEAIAGHLRAWAVKGFFLAFMLSVVPPGFGEMVRAPLGEVVGDPVRLAGWLIGLMFVIDCAFATAGYMLTLRPLDSHIRSANPFAASWTAALICYPPFAMMDRGRPLDYAPGTYGVDGWTTWFAGHPWLLAGWGAVLVALTAVYAWATVAFGFRFSNLTDRGILTHGPYAFSKHPAYLSKNLFWWLSTLPMLTTGSWIDATRATVLMAAVSGVYYWRARTEERHLGLDPVYRAYSRWMRRHAPVPRFFGWLAGRR